MTSILVLIGLACIGGFIALAIREIYNNATARQHRE